MFDRKQIPPLISLHAIVIARVISKCSTGQRTAGAFIEILEGRTLKRIPSPFGPSHPERHPFGMSSKRCVRCRVI